MNPLEHSVDGSSHAPPLAHAPTNRAAFVQPRPRQELTKLQALQGLAAPSWVLHLVRLVTCACLRHNTPSGPHPFHSDASRSARVEEGPGHYTIGLCQDGGGSIESGGRQRSAGHHDTTKGTREEADNAF